MAKLNRRRFVVSGLTAGLTDTAIAQTTQAQTAPQNPKTAEFYYCPNGATFQS
ncbi:MAG: hypothetical protein IGS48_13335 [Oscillatoriales cyanobacterium C42_A2020_001]|nr:hypothetical protein [Leptolyngbyaceae cyanobacterium C42_A2020_001]